MFFRYQHHVMLAFLFGIFSHISPGCGFSSLGGIPGKKTSGIKKQIVKPKPVNPEELLLLLEVSSLIIDNSSPVNNLKETIFDTNDLLLFGNDELNLTKKCDQNIRVSGYENIIKCYALYNGMIWLEDSFTEVTLDCQADFLGEIHLNGGTVILQNDLNLKGSSIKFYGPGIVKTNGFTIKKDHNHQVHVVHGSVTMVRKCG